MLIDSGASFTLEDIKFRTPVDLVSGPVAQVIGEKHNSGKQSLLNFELYLVTISQTTFEKLKCLCLFSFLCSGYRGFLLGEWSKLPTWNWESRCSEATRQS